MFDIVWQDLGAAVALLMVMEGVMPFMNPAGFRDAMRRVADLPDKTLRTIGMFSLFGGAFLLYLVRS